MSENDDRRSKLHASYRRKKINVRVGETSIGSREVSLRNEPDFYLDEFEQFERDLEEEERNYQGSGDEEAGNEEAGNEDAENVDAGNEKSTNMEATNVEGTNVEAANVEGTNVEGANVEATSVEGTSVFRIRRGQHGRFESYAEGSSSSVVEPRRKVRARGKDSSWILSGPLPGGPLVPDLIPSFGGHISYLMWNQPGFERGLLTKYTRDRSLVELRKWNLAEAVRKIVVDSGLSHLPDIMHKQLNMPLLCAFIERWQPDTNTFHMPWGEMTILLHDVEEILRIEIQGYSCSIPEADMAHPVLGMSELLAMTEAMLGEQWEQDNDAKIYKGNLILQKALKGLVEGCKRGVASEAQGYLMILLSSTLFVDKSSDRVRANIFPMLREVGSIGKYAWGAGTLAYLYRQLGIASRADCKGLCGCLTLLQSWIFEYFPCFRPMATLAATPGTPRASLWSTSSIPRAEADRALVSYREQLDLLPIESVAWRPYPDEPETEHPSTAYQGLLRFIDIVEPYQPDRCLRQFGYMQNIPPPMPPPDKAYRPVKSIAYDVQYDGAYGDYTWNNWEMHRVHLDRRSLPAHPPHAYTKGYLEWFGTHSHPFVMNVPRDSDQIPTARSHFPTSVGQSLIQRFSQFEDVEDPAMTGEFRQFMRTVHPEIRAYTGRPQVDNRGRGSRGRADRGRGDGGNDDQVE